MSSKLVIPDVYIGQYECQGNAPMLQPVQKDMTGWQEKEGQGKVIQVADHNREHVGQLNQNRHILYTCVSYKTVT